MGIVKAVKSAISGTFSDQWLEVFEADNMGDQTVFTSGVKIRKGQNTKGSSDTVSNGSVIHVYPNQFMMLVDGGKIIDYTAEEGYYTVNNSSMPSMLNGELEETLKESFNRIRHGGKTPGVQKVYFINLQEIKGIKFGTRNPINYFDNFYNAELFLRAHGTYSLKITDPILFYAEAIPKNANRVQIDSINEQYVSEFLEALQSSINQMSADGIRISYVSSKARELGQYMSNTLDDEWRQSRGMEIQSVGISISYDENSNKLINLRNQGAMLSDPTVREGYVQGAMARGLEAAGSNANGPMAGFMGMGVGMQAGGGFMGAASATNMQQMQMQQQMSPNPYPQNMPQQNISLQNAAPHSMPPQNILQSNIPYTAGNAPKSQTPASPSMPDAASMSNGWTCSCGSVNTGKFCSECGTPRPANHGPWTCSCGNTNTGRFCSECGKPRL